MLYSSHRRSPRQRSVTRTGFSIVMSVVWSGAARRPLRGELPNVNGAGCANALRSNHCWTDGGVSDASRSRLGRSGPAGNALVVFTEVITVNGGPDSSVSRI